MANQMNPQQLLANKESYYETVTRRVRWLAIIIVAATYPPTQPQYRLMLMAIAAATIFNALRYWHRALRWRLFASRITTLVADTALIGVLIGLSGGIHSPYIIFWIFTLISAAYWYGKLGVVIILGWELVVSIMLITWHAPIAPTDNIRVSLLQILSLAAVALLAERLTHVDRNERTVMARVNQQIETERERLLALVNSLVDPVVAIDGNGKIGVYNGAALDLLNTNQQLGGQNLSDFLHLEDAKKVPLPLASILGHTSVIKRTDLAMRLGDGSIANLDISVAPIYGQGTNAQNYILIMRDITKQKSLDQERDAMLKMKKIIVADLQAAHDAA